MDTKLKKFNDYLAVRVCAFVLCIALLLISATTVFLGLKKISDVLQHSNESYYVTFSDITKNDSFLETESFKRNMQSACGSINTMLKFGNREDIKSGKFVEDAEVLSQLKEEYEVRAYDIDQTNETYYKQYGDSKNNPDYYSELKPFSEVKDQYMKDFPNLVNNIREGIISYQLGEFDTAKNLLNELDIAYTATRGSISVTNSMQINNPGFTMSMADGVITSSLENMQTSMLDEYTVMTSDEKENTVFNMAISGERIDESNNTFETAKKIYNDFSIIAVVTFIIFLLLLIYNLIITGRRDENGNVKLYRTDKLFTELQILILGCLTALATLPIFLLANGLGDLSISTWLGEAGNIALLMLGIALEGIISAGILWFLLSIIRMLKAHIFIRRSLIVIAIKNIARWIKAAFNRANPMGKFIIIIVAACLLSMTLVLAPIVICLVLAFGYRWIKKYTELKKGVEEVVSGNLEYKIPVDQRSNTEFDQLAKQINTISQASNVAIQNELKNQRLKTDLISNVSHDLKTPLTSIITYTDLLKTEGLESPNASAYLDVIDEKGQRLKNLTEDLFEAAKASSGSIPVRMEKVEVLSLINQGLVELGEGLEKKGLEVIINAHQEKYYVNADSQLLWRVVENLLNNIEKYALENSRVYIDIREKTLNDNNPPMVLFEIKNMSKAPLNIPEEELMERFKRGDESRNTEGSGLGLAIAKDLVRLQNGWFELKIDGDLFKSTVMLESYNEEAIKKASEMKEASERMHSQQEDDKPKIM